MLQAYVLESHRGVGLNDLAQRYRRSGVSYEDLCGKGAKQIGFDEVAVDKAGHYAAEDADFTLQLHHALRPQVEADAGLNRIYLLEMQVSAVLTIIERNGVKVDAAELGRQSHKLGQEMLQLEQKAYELAGQPFNLNSPSSWARSCSAACNCRWCKTAGGAPSTDEEVLTKLAQDYPLPQVLLEYRGPSKLKSTYTDKLPRMVNPATGRVHTHYSQAAVITGRLASSDPNLQNIPVRTEAGRRVREAFIAENGMLLSADYSQIELRIMAHVSDDANLQRLRGGRGHPPRHGIRGVRRVAGSGQLRAARGQGHQLRPDLRHGRVRPGVEPGHHARRGAGLYRPLLRALSRRGDVHGRDAPAGSRAGLCGNRLRSPPATARDPRRFGPAPPGAERAAINAPMQGTAADLIKMAMVAVQDWLQAEACRPA